MHARAPPIHTEENTKLIRSQNMQPIRFNPSLTVKLNANRNYEYVHDWLIFLSYLMVKYSLSFKFQSVGFGAMHMVSQFTTFYFWFHVHSGERERERERERVYENSFTTFIWRDKLQETFALLKLMQPHIFSYTSTRLFIEIINHVITWHH